MPEEVLILCFSRKKAEEIRNKTKERCFGHDKSECTRRIRVLNLHALAARFLREVKDYRFGHHNQNAHDLDRLLNPKKQPKYLRLDKNLEFSAMIQDFGQYLAAHSSSVIGKFKLIAVDELQILNEGHLIALLGVLKHAGLPELIIAGDSNQDIFHWHKKNGKPEDSYALLREALAGTYELVATRNLRYRRGTNEIAHFYQGFENIVETGVVVRPHRSAGPGSKPEVVLVEDRITQEKELQNRIKQISRVYPRESLMVVGRHKYVLAGCRHSEVCQAMTIYESLGSEADHVIWVGMSNMDAEIQLQSLIRVALTRARKSLTIISTDKASLVTRWFEPGTYDVINKQRVMRRSQGRKNLKKVWKGRNKTINNFGYLDSIVLSIAHEDIPFTPFISNNTKTRRKGMVEEERHWHTLNLAENTTVKDIPTYAVRRFMLKDGKCSYKFRFMSLAFLSLNKFNEKDILQACQNEIIEFFDGRIDSSAIRISRLDLASHFICSAEQKKMLRTRLYEVGGAVGRYRNRSVYNILEGGAKTQELSDSTETTYVNNGSKAEGVTVAAYDPAKKDSKSASTRINTENNRLANKKLNRQDMFKIEIRPQGLRTVKSWVGSNRLIDLIQGYRKIPGLYWEWATNLGIVEGDRVLGLNYDQKSWGGFRLVDDVENTALDDATVYKTVVNGAEVANKIRGQVDLGFGGRSVDNRSGLELKNYTLYYSKIG